MAADIVQFVPYRDFANNPMELAKETLEEVPGQMLGYFKKHGIKPNPANEMQRRQLQQQLSRTKSLGNSQKQDDNKETFFKGFDDFVTSFKPQNIQTKP